MITIYSDGAIQGNPGGTGGWAAILLWPFSQAPGLTGVLEIGGSELGTTNNRMEMMGPIMGLGRLKSEGATVRIVSDSQYVVKGMSEWIDGWIRRRELGGKINSDLWHRLLEQRAKHRIEWAWVRGHNGDFWNERADRIAGDMVKRAIAGQPVNFERRYLFDTDAGAERPWPEARQPERA